jgi:long-chain fatty acid transport protein
MKTILKIASLSIITSSVLFASAWRIPEQSAKSVALSGAYIANSNKAEASYYNPANMSFNADQKDLEISLMHIHLTGIKYKDNTTTFKDGISKEENFVVPTIFFTSCKHNNFRYGFSITAPGGLAKRWDYLYEKLYAEEFSLKIIEFNPVVSYMLGDSFSIAGGLRAVYSKGIVKSDGTTIKPVARDMEGNTLEYGYNMALAYKITNKSNISLTYRSNVDLKEEGNAKLYLSRTKVYDGGANVTVPLPAVLSAAYSFKFNKTTIEIEYDKTYWSKYKALDFEYDSPIPLVLKGAFDNPKDRQWKDTRAYRLGITHQLSNKTTIMFGYAKDENPEPTKNVGFELPDSDATLYSAGFDYKLDKKSSFSVGYLVDIKDSRKVTNYDENNQKVVDGEFTDAKAYLLSVAYRISF